MKNREGKSCTDFISPKKGLIYIVLSEKCNKNMYIHFKINIFIDTYIYVYKFYFILLSFNVNNSSTYMLILSCVGTTLALFH